jgi:hypothetical protein
VYISPISPICGQKINITLINIVSTMKSLKSILVPSFVALCALIALLAFNRSTNEVKKTTNVSTSHPLSKQAVGGAKGIAVLELFTSEGCSSCPPADDVLRELAKDSNVMALSFHVTYWNRLGWTDSFSQKIFDERQYAYGEKFRANGVYTPQAIINGSAEMVGSKRAQVAQAVKKAVEASAQVTISLTKTIKAGDIELHYALTGAIPKDAVLQFAIVESGFSTKVKRGENNGQILKHDNVVRDFETRKAANTEGVVSFFPLSGWQVKNCSVVAFVQEKDLGRIIGAAKVKL